MRRAGQSPAGGDERDRLIGEHRVQEVSAAALQTGGADPVADAESFVGEHAMEHASPPKAAPTDGARATLAIMGLEPIAQAMPSELSEGQRKLVGLARALVPRPRLLCLDEPAAGLDTCESQALGERLRELAGHGQSTLLIDHDMGLVLGICDRVVVLEFGRVIADGSPEVVRGDSAVIAAYLRGGSASAAPVVDPAR